jgi:hypothetical protein
MTLVSSLDLLQQRLQKLHDELHSLHTRVMDDKPDESVAQPEIIGAIVEDLLGWLEESLAQWQQARASLDLPTMVQQHLRACYNPFERALRRFFTDLARYERVLDLVRVGRTRGAAWRQWSASVRRALDVCYLPLFDVSQAFCLCWQELAECNAPQNPTQISAHLINIYVAKGGEHE